MIDINTDNLSNLQKSPYFETILGGNASVVNEEGVAELTYQQKAVLELYNNIDTALYARKNNSRSKAMEILLQAPTGSGKTIIAGGLIHALFKNYNDLVILWISETPSLTRQSLEKFQKYYGIEQSFYGESGRHDVQGNQVIGVNWEKLKNKNIREENEKQSSIDNFLANCKEANLKVITMIDEAHSHANSKLSKDFLKITESTAVIHITATPTQSYETEVIIPIEDVQKTGYIKQGIVIQSILANYNAEYREKHLIGTQQEYILNESLLKRDELEEKLRLYNKDVLHRDEADAIIPLLVIQLPNNNTKMLKSVESFLNDKGYTRENGLGVYMSDDYTDELDKISNDNSIKVLLFKQAISKGWDCPRASAITLLRSPTNQPFVTQTIGRILRNPYLKNYPLAYDELNYGYVFIEESDNVVLQNIVNSFKDDGFNKTLIRKENLTTEIDKLTRHEKVVTTPTFNKYKPKLMRIFKELVEQNRWNEKFSLDSKLLTKTGISRLDTSELAKSGLRIDFTEEEEISYTNADYFEIIKSFIEKNKLNKVITYDLIIPFVRDILIRASVEGGSNHKPRHVATVIYHNKELVIEMHDKVLQVFKLQYPNKIKIVTKEWAIPSTYTLSDIEEVKKELSNTEIFPYDEVYAHKTNKLEQRMSRYLNDNPHVKLWYKNGDFGRKYFSIAYKELDTVLLFYPDFLIETEKALYIYETKGMDSDSMKTIAKEATLQAHVKALNENQHSTGITLPIKCGIVQEKENTLYVYEGTDYANDYNLQTSTTGDWKELNIV